MVMVEFSNYLGECESCTSQRWSMKFCMLTDLQKMKNF
jgi:hypothetical protein